MKPALPVAVLLLAFSGAVAADIEPGQWEITATTQMEGMPQPIGPISRTECLSGDTARDPGRILGTSGGACEFSNRRDSGGTATFDVSCGGQFPMRGTGAVTYGPQTLEGRLDLGAELSGKRVGMNSRISGRRLGACTQ